MANPGLVARLKLNLSLTTKAYDDYLGQLLDAASGMIAREGINLNTKCEEDAQILVMYAAYRFRKRAEDNPVMPRMLRYALNNRLFSQKIREGGV